MNTIDCLQSRVKSKIGNNNSQEFCFNFSPTPVRLYMRRCIPHYRGLHVKKFKMPLERLKNDEISEQIRSCILLTSNAMVAGLRKTTGNKTMTKFGL